MTKIKCTGLKCSMQVGKVDPATCKAAGTCEWAGIWMRYYPSHWMPLPEPPEEVNDGN